MGDYEEISEEIDRLKDYILNSLNISLFSRLSVEGIISCSILATAIQRLKKNFSISFFEEINNEKIKEFSSKKDKIIIDIKISDLKLIENIDKLMFINKTDYSVSEKTYMLAKNIDTKNKDLAYITLFSNGYHNNNLLAEAEESGKIIQSRGFKILGSNTRPIHKAIETSISPFIIGFSGSEENTINLLKDLDIKIRTNESWVTLQDLDENKINGLLNALSLNYYKKDEILGSLILIKDEEKNSQLRDVNEFNLFLHASVLYKKPSIALARCMMKKNYKNKAIEIIRKYRQDIIKALSLYYTENDNELTIEKENFIIINFKNFISEEIIEDTVEFIQNSKLYNQKKRVIALCQTKEDKIKWVISCFDKKIDFNLNGFLSFLPESINKDFDSETNISFCVNFNEEKKITELILEHLETIRMEEIRE